MALEALLPDEPRIGGSGAADAVEVAIHGAL